MRAIRKHMRDFLAILGLGLIAGAVAVYILNEQRLRFPFIEPKPFEITAAFSTAQAVTPGQGQTVQVAGVQIGQIGPVELEDGRALVELQIEPRFRKLIRRDATALLRPRTGLKDMYIQLNPGLPSTPAAREGHTIPVRNTLPDVNLDEILGALDADTRDYVRLLVSGAGRGLDRRGNELAEVFRRFEPTYRDLARVTSAVAVERAALRRSINALARLNGELASGDNPRDLAQLVDASAVTFRAFASEQAGLRATVRELPPALKQTSQTLRTVRTFADELGPTARSLLPAVRQLDDTNRAVRPFAVEATPIIRDQIRPFTREVRPLLVDIREPADELADATPDLTRSFRVLNHLFNMLGYNQDGREDPGKDSRDEGYLFWIAWVTHNTVNLFNVEDGNGPLRPVLLTGTCSTLFDIAQGNALAAAGLNITRLLDEQCGISLPNNPMTDVESSRQELVDAGEAAGLSARQVLGDRFAAWQRDRAKGKGKKKGKTGLPIDGLPELGATLPGGDQGDDAETKGTGRGKSKGKKGKDG